MIKCFIKFYSFSLNVHRYYSIPRDELPTMLQEHMKVKNTRCDSVRKNTNKRCDQSKNKKHSPNKNERYEQSDGNNCRDANDDQFYSLKLGCSDIYLIDERIKFDEMLIYLSNQQMIAFDAEWKPISTSFVDIALIQFATTDKIYLLDVLKIDIDINDWNNLATKVFNNVEILKIGKISHNLTNILF